MKLLIDVEKEYYEMIKYNVEHGQDYKPFEIIANGIPYEPKGDLISREALKEALEVTQYNDIDDLTRTERLIDNAPTVEPCYQTTSCLDCKNYDKETHNCPRYCEIIKEAIKSRPQGEWYYNHQNGWHCSICHEPVKDMPTVMCKANFAFCPNCGARMKGGTK